MAKITITELQLALAHFDAIPIKVGPRDGRRSHRGWIEAVDAVANLVAIIRRSKHPVRWWADQICKERDLYRQNLFYICAGRMPSTPNLPWPELRAALERIGVGWDTAWDERMAAARKLAAPKTMPSAACKPSRDWRMIGDDIEITTTTTLRYGTPEHAAKLREIMRGLDADHKPTSATVEHTVPSTTPVTH